MSGSRPTLKYGLNLPAGRGRGRGPPPPRPPLAAFAGGDSSDSDGDAGVARAVARQAAQKAADAKAGGGEGAQGVGDCLARARVRHPPPRPLFQVAAAHAAALAQDATAFQYDEVYDDNAAAARGAVEASRADRAPRYVSSLLAQAKARKFEEEAAKERR